MVWRDIFLVGYSYNSLTGLNEVVEEAVTIQGFMDKFLRHCHLIDPEEAILRGKHLGWNHFPEHFIFGNFSCLRCGLCCKNWEFVEVNKEQIKKWEIEGREDVLKYIPYIDGRSTGEIYPRGDHGCPMCRKVVNKPYYSCRIQDSKENLPVCRDYICRKSLPVAHLDFKNVDELIKIVGLNKYYRLIERH